MLRNHYQTVLHRKEIMRLTQNLKDLLEKTQNPKKFLKNGQELVRTAHLKAQ